MILRAEDDGDDDNGEHLSSPDLARPCMRSSKWGVEAMIGSSPPPTIDRVPGAEPKLCLPAYSLYPRANAATSFPLLVYPLRIPPHLTPHTYRHGRRTSLPVPKGSLQSSRRMVVKVS